MSWQKLHSVLEQNRRRLDLACAAAVEQVGATWSTIYCTKGCANCCTLAVNCAFAEARAIAAGLNEPQRQLIGERAAWLVQLNKDAADLKDFLRRHRSESGGCPFLDPVTQSCQIYAQRPLACRALLSTRPAAWCGVDFSTLHPLEKQAFLSSLDPQLVAYPTHYLATPQELATELEDELQAVMLEQFNCTLSGNLIYLIWLQLEFDLAEQLANAPDQLARFLHSRELEQSYLLQFRQ